KRAIPDFFGVALLDALEEILVHARDRSRCRSGAADGDDLDVSDVRLRRDRRRNDGPVRRRAVRHHALAAAGDRLDPSTGNVDADEIRIAAFGRQNDERRPVGRPEDWLWILAARRSLVPADRPA